MLNCLLRRCTRLLACAAFLSVALSASAQPGTRVPTVTRLVKIVIGLETDLAEHLRGGRGPAAEALLTDDFELRLSNGPGQPVPRAEWLKEALARPGPMPAFEQVAVHEYGELAVASFHRRVPAEGGTKAETQFIVDVWKRNGDNWKLATRYAAPAGGADFTSVGAGVREAPIHKRY